MGQEHLYEERISSARTEALFVALTVVALAVLGWRYPSAGMDGWSVLLLVAAAFFLFYSVNYRALLIRVNADTLRLRFGLFEWAIPLANIDSCSADTVSLWRIGGAGIHFTSIDRRYRAMFNFLEYPRLVVRLRTKQGPVRDLVFSTRKPDELRGLLLRMDPKEGTHLSSRGDSADAQDISRAKRAVRSQCRIVRNGIGELNRSQASERICSHIQAWGSFQSARVVFTYLPMRGEVDLRPLFHFAPKIQWAIPRVVDAPAPHLLFHAYQPERLVLHRYGMLEPDPAAPLIEPGQADLILVPGLAFDRRGFRIGYGGGYYDRLLAQHGRAAATLGICFQAVLLDAVPHEAHDVPVGFVVTETCGVLPCASSA